MKKILIPCLMFFITSLQLVSALDKDYFNKLKTQKVLSTDSITWEQFGPGSAGYCEKLWCHPTDSTVLFMGPDMHVAYGSWDDGETWQTIKDCDGTGRLLERIQDIDFSRQNSSFGMLIDLSGWDYKLKGTPSYVYTTNDKGHTWQMNMKLGLGCSCLSVDPNNDKVWYIGSGGFWDVKMNHRSAAHPHGQFNKKRYAYGNVWKTSDMGRTWHQMNKGLPEDLDIGKIIVNPENSDQVIMCTNYGLYKSINGGKSWKCDGGNLPYDLTRDLAIYHDEKITRLYCLLQTKYKIENNSVSAKGGVYISDDFGKTWQNKTGDLGSPIGLIHGSFSKVNYFKAVSAWTGIAKSDLKKIKVPDKILAVYNRLAVNPKDQNEVYLMYNSKHDRTFGPGNLIKTDNLKNWYYCARNGSYWLNKAVADSSVWKKLHTPTYVNTFFGHLQYEMDRLDGDLNRGTRALAVGCNGNVHIEIGQQYLRSRDQGNTWKNMDDYEIKKGSDAWIGRGDSNLPGRFILLDTGIKGRSFMCSGEHGLWEMQTLTDKGNVDKIAVKQIEGQCEFCHGVKNGATSISSVAVNPQNPSEIYTVQFRQNHRDDFMKSSDGGKTWSKVSTCINYDDKNLSGHHIFKFSLILDYKNPKNIYFTAIRESPTDVGSWNEDLKFQDYGVYKSTNGGLNWSIKNNGLPEGCSVNHLIMDKENPKIIYACLNQCKYRTVDNPKGVSVKGGLYITYDAGENWHKVDIPSEIVSVNNLHFDINGNMYLSAGQQTEYDKGGVWKSTDRGNSWVCIFDMPNVVQTETSPIDSNIIIVDSYWTNKIDMLNPGIYISHNGGKTWSKSNRNIGQPNKIVDIKPDLYDKNVFWCASWGCGWYRGIWKSKKKNVSD